MVLESEVGSALKAVIELAQHNVTQVVESVKSAFSEGCKPLMEQARWTVAQVANDLKVSVSRSDTGLHREIAKCFAM